MQTKTQTTPTPGPWQIGPAIDSRKVFQGDSVIAEAWPTTINMDEDRVATLVALFLSDAEREGVMRSVAVLPVSPIRSNQQHVCES